VGALHQAVNAVILFVRKVRIMAAFTSVGL